MADLLSKAKQKITPSWRDILSPEFSKSYFTHLEKFLFEDAKQNLERVQEEKSILLKQQGDLFIQNDDDQNNENVSNCHNL